MGQSAGVQRGGGGGGAFQEVSHQIQNGSFQGGFRKGSFQEAWHHTGTIKEGDWSQQRGLFKGVTKGTAEAKQRGSGGVFRKEERFQKRMIAESKRWRGGGGGGGGKRGNSSIISICTSELRLVVIQKLENDHFAPREMNTYPLAPYVLQWFTAWSHMHAHGSSAVHFLSPAATLYLPIRDERLLSPSRFNLVIFLNASPSNESADSWLL